MASISHAQVSQWGRFEQTFTAERRHDSPFHAIQLRVTFSAPSGRSIETGAFWDGGDTWRVRFMPDEIGDWTYLSTCSDAEDHGLNDRRGAFSCVASSGATAFERHGAIRVSDDHRYFEHADGTPWLWLADTAWNGALLSSADDWRLYLDTRRTQRFSAVQWVATQWIAAPGGDANGDLAFTGLERIEVNPAFFQRLDARLGQINAAGLLGVPVLLWAATWIPNDAVNSVNPGISLPEDQAIALARYMVARWGAHHVAWILNGDGDYRGERAERWRRIGQAVFGKQAHAPVLLHPSGMNIPYEEFRNEAWLDVVTYQSGHGDDGATLRWIWDGPPARVWRQTPTRPVINLEPPYEDHIAYQSQERISAHTMRRAAYWSLLITPPAGVTYGGHGVWGWDDGTQPPTAHPATGIPQPWQQALHLPGAEQMPNMMALFEGLDWWRLRPAPDMLVDQPGLIDPARFVAAARSQTGDIALVYTPVAQSFELDTSEIYATLAFSWFNPVTGARQDAHAAQTPRGQQFTPPGDGDWALIGREPRP